MDVANYPLDTQECFYQVGSWTYNSNFLLLKVKDNGTEIPIPYLIPNSEWDMVSTRMYSDILQFEATYPMTQFYLTLRRKVSFYTFALIMPCILLTLLTMMVFFIPSQSGEKISLGKH